MSRLSIAVCRGCCCGTDDKHGNTDHRSQVEALRLAVADNPEARLWVTDCLGPCERSNVIVVRAGGVRRWFGPILPDWATAAMVSWLADGAPDQPPPELEHLIFEPPTTASR